MSLKKNLFLTDKNDIEDHSQESHSHFFKESSKKKQWPNLKAALDVMIKKLPPKEGMILKMLFHENLPPSEIAKKLRIDDSSVRRLRKKGLELLKEKFKSIEVNKKLQTKGIYL